MQSPAWPNTLLIITYDEHGGFFDHVQPPDQIPDDHGITRLGPRVPAIIVSPFVKKRAVSKTVFDHTSIIKTILTCFCADGNGTIPEMGARVAAATSANCSPVSPRKDQPERLPGAAQPGRGLARTDGARRHAQQGQPAATS